MFTINVLFNISKLFNLCSFKVFDSKYFTGVIILAIEKLKTWAQALLLDSNAYENMSLFIKSK